MSKDQIDGEYFICSKCGNKYELGSATLYKDKLICGICVEKYLTSCKSCGELIPKQYNYCEDCNNKIYQNILNPYSTKPNPNFKNYKTSNNNNLKTVYYGLELEYNYVNPIAIRYKLNDLYNNKLLYNKSDGSISSGVEIVTVPCDLKSIKKLLYDMKDGFDYIKTISNNDDNAGIHIHVSRNCLPPFSVYKLHKLLNMDNFYSVDDLKAIYFLSGRLENIKKTFNDYEYRYCSVGRERIDRIDVDKYRRSSFNDKRHIAVNLHNKNTIEFRIFKSTPDIETIYSYLEIVNTLISFANTYGINDMSIYNYIKYLKSNTKNKILLSKIEVINNNLELNDINYYVTEEDIYKYIKGIKWDKYIELSNLPSKKINNRCLLEYLIKIKNDENYSDINYIVTGDNNKIINNLLSTYKKVVINKILRSKNKCA